MPETRSRWSIEPYVALTIAINLIGWGLTIGKILTKIDTLEHRTDKLEHRVFPEADASERK
jgi:hypothetical protein